MISLVCCEYGKGAMEIKFDEADRKALEDMMARALARGIISAVRTLQRAATGTALASPQGLEHIHAARTCSSDTTPDRPGLGSPAFTNPSSKGGLASQTKISQGA